MYICRQTEVKISINGEAAKALHRLLISRPVSRVLSFKTAIYLDAPLPMRSSRLPGTAGPAYCPSTALLRIEFTAPFRLRTVGELLPRLSTLTCPKAGGISLLHLSWGHPRRALPVILALWSPDFPHAQAFALCPRLLGFLAQVFYLFKARLSTAIGVEFLLESEYNI